MGLVLAGTDDPAGKLSCMAEQATHSLWRIPCARAVLDLANYRHTPLFHSHFPFLRRLSSLMGCTHLSLRPDFFYRGNHVCRSGWGMHVSGIKRTPDGGNLTLREWLRPVLDPEYLRLAPFLLCELHQVHQELSEDMYIY